MSVQIALLRGVNVGGKNKISMAELKAAFREAGFPDATTYINSGNVLFTSNKNAAQLKEICEALIKETFGLAIGVMVISADDLAKALDATPDWWGKDKESRHNVIFVIPPATALQVCAQVGEIKPEYESLFYHGRVIFWSSPKEDFNKTRWSKVSRNAAYLTITIRNITTANTLRALATTMAEGE